MQRRTSCRYYNYVITVKNVCRNTLPIHQQKRRAHESGCRRSYGAIACVFSHQRTRGCLRTWSRGRPNKLPRRRGAKTSAVSRGKSPSINTELLKWIDRIGLMSVKLRRRVLYFQTTVGHGFYKILPIGTNRESTGLVLVGINSGSQRGSSHGPLEKAQSSGSTYYFTSCPLIRWITTIRNRQWNKQYS